MSPVVATPEQLEVIETRSPSVARMFYDRVEKSANREAYRYPDADEVWHSMTWAETGEHVTRLAAGLVALGIQPEQRVAIASGTRYEWIFADLAINAAAAATTTVYPTTAAEDVAYILADSGSRIVFAEDDEQIKKLTEKRSELPEVIKVVTFDGQTDGDWVIGFDDLEKLGDDLLEKDPKVIEERVARHRAGRPRHPHLHVGHHRPPQGRPAQPRRLDVRGRCARGRRLPQRGRPGVPLAADGALLRQGAPDRPARRAASPAAIDGRVPKIVENLAIVKPTFMGAAPRIFEKAYGRIVGMVEEEGGAKLKIFRWAEGVGREYSRAVRSGKPVSPVLKAKYAVADKLVFAKVRDRFGGRIRFFISGAAALSQDIAEWFHGAGILILEGYGLTETSAGAFVNRPTPSSWAPSACRCRAPRSRSPRTARSCSRARTSCSGYHNLESESASALLEGGWLATGDIGEIDAEGFLRITDRKKDLFKTSGGKYVAPSYVEGVFKGVCSLASQMVVHGNDRNFCTALITLDPDAVAAWAESHGMSGKSYSEVVSSPEMHEVISKDVDELNAKLNRWETIKKFAILDHDLTVESGELTPSLKLKRKVVEENYRDILDGFYSD